MKTKWLLAAAMYLAWMFPLQAQHNQMSVGYDLMLPTGEMKTGWSSAHGVQAEIMFPIHKPSIFSLGSEMAFGMYAYNHQQQDYLIFNGILASSEVSFSSYVGTLGLKGKLESPKIGSVKPYAMLQFGVFYISSDLSLDDWASSNSSYYYDNQYADTKTLVDDADWFASAGGGLKFDLSYKKKPGRNFLDLSVAYMGGGEVKYANMNRMQKTVAGPVENRDVITVVFINSITSERQYMEVAEVYRHPISLLQCQVKYVFAF